MGMFDSVYVKCRSCGSEVEFQSKAGECALRSYYFGVMPPSKGAVPDVIAADLIGKTEVCESCGASVALNGYIHVWVMPS